MHEYGWLSGSIYINVPKKKTVDSGNLVVCIDDTDETNKKSIDVVDWKSLSFSCFFTSLYNSV